MSALHREVKSSVRLPGPGEDATPFLLRCYVKHVPFRPLQDFDRLRPGEDEFKLYVWRSATLRDIATLLHMRDPLLSTPITTHTFRVVYFDDRRGIWAAREELSGVTRISKSTFEDIHHEVLDEDEAIGVEGVRSDLFAETVQKTRPQMSPDANEEYSMTTLEDLGFVDGEVLDCVIKSPAHINIKKVRGGDLAGTTMDRPRGGDWRSRQGMGTARDRVWVRQGWPESDEEKHIRVLFRKPL